MIIKTTSLASGLHCPYKGLSLAALVSALNGLPTASVSMAAPKGAFLFAFVHRLTRKRVYIFLERYLICYCIFL